MRKFSQTPLAAVILVAVAAAIMALDSLIEAKPFTGVTQPVSQECIITVPAEEWASGDGRYRVNL